jgi:hypothetical protein
VYVNSKDCVVTTNAFRLVELLWTAITEGRVVRCGIVSLLFCNASAFTWHSPHILTQGFYGTGSISLGIYLWKLYRKKTDKQDTMRPFYTLDYVLHGDILNS